MVSNLVWGIKNQNRINSSDFVDHGLAPTAGLEPATSKLTASCSTIELRRNTRIIIPITLSISQSMSVKLITHLLLNLVLLQFLWKARQ
jgi:hypothetical protein